MATVDPQPSAAMRVTKPGPPEVMEWTEQHPEQLLPTDIVVRHEAIGLNFHDIYVRNGSYNTMPYPGVPGIEASGVVEEVGDAVVGLNVGDRIAYITSLYGAYATRRILPAALALPLPDDIPHAIAAAVLLKGLTADMLLTRLRVLEAGAVVVVHAAAGGVGQILTQMARSLGITVIGAVGSLAKAGVVRGLGCDHVVLYGNNELLDCVRNVTDGRGADMVFDGVGAATFATSIDCLRPFGHLALFGQASGPVPPIELALLAQRSLSISRPVVFHHAQDPERYRGSAERVFKLVQSGVIKVAPPNRYPLREAAKAHRLLESGMTSGSTILIPG